MKRLVLSLLAVISLCDDSNAMPEPGFDFYLKRAEKVMLAKVISSGKSIGTDTLPYTITFRCSQLLRGTSPSDLTLPSFTARQNGTEVLLISQGDLHYGPPESVLLMDTKGQGVWCGWIEWPVNRANDQYILQIYISRHAYDILGKSHERNGKLTISDLKRLLEYFPYDPHIHDGNKALH